EVLFHGISVKPGKPTAFGLVNGKPFFGMPGYPSSCLLNTHILLVPALRFIARLPALEQRTVTLPLTRRVVSAKDRHQFYTVRNEKAELDGARRLAGKDDDVWRSRHG